MLQSFDNGGFGKQLNYLSDVTSEGASKVDL